MGPVASLHEQGGVLLALRGYREPTDCLRRALTISQRSSQQLDLLRVLPKPSLLAKLGELISPDDELQREYEAYEKTMRWLLRSLGESGQFTRVIVTHGKLEEEVVRRAAAVGARLIVLSSDAEPTGRQAISIARKSGVPVLASRAEGTGGAIVAATDLTRADFPVLTKAVSLATILGKDLVTVHNAGPLSALASVVVLPNVVISGGVSEAMRRESLARATTGLPVAATPAMRTEYHAADGILKEARSRDASLIVVGTHRRSWLERALSPSVAQCVVDEARRSVLVTPIGDARSHGLTSKQSSARV